eukprot:PhF_6_TR10006/c0_g1_i1/m.15251
MWRSRVWTVVYLWCAKDCAKGMVSDDCNIIAVCTARRTRCLHNRSNVVRDVIIIEHQNQSNLPSRQSNASALRVCGVDVSSVPYAVWPYWNRPRRYCIDDSSGIGNDFVLRLVRQYGRRC